VWVPLLGAWFAFVTTSSLWLPGYKGTTGVGASEVATAAALYAFVAGLSALAARQRAQTHRSALLATGPVLALVVAAAAAGYLVNRDREELRGEPVFLYFGIALWASWAALVLSTAFVARSRWNSLTGIVAGLVVAALGFLEFTSRID
jgi:hypothetical protein